MTSTETQNPIVEKKCEVMETEDTSDPDGDRDGERFNESGRCSTCKCHRGKRDDEVERLRQDNKKLRAKVAELEEVVSRRRTEERPLSRQTSTDRTDGMAGGGPSEENEGLGAMEGSSEMSHKNDSAQTKGDKAENAPSTSSRPRNASRSGSDPEGAAGGVDDSDTGNSCPLSDLKGVYTQLDRLNFSSSHTVLVDVDLFCKDKTLVAKEGRQMWDNNFVRMPCAEESILTKETQFLGHERQTRWETIKKQLNRLAKSSSVTPSDVENAIKKYNPKYKDQWSFEALHTFFKALASSERATYPRILSRIAGLALKLPLLCKKGIPLLRQGHKHSITLSQPQIACLLANAFYCTFPLRNTTHYRSEYANFPTINFQSLFSNWSDRKAQKFRAIFHYFRVVTHEGEGENVPKGLVTFSRHFIKDHELPQWKSRTETLTKLHVASEGTIEKDGLGMLQVDFACSLVGGGVLGSGLVQEEILFLINPELIVARLFTEKLGDTECLKITGSQQYSDYCGYSDSFQWNGPHEDPTERDEWGRRRRQIVAIDALHFKCSEEQFIMTRVTRELNKAYCGFQGESNIHPDYYAVATGNWGCGAFGGDPKLKALIQMMAASVAKKKVAYFTFENSHLQKEILRIYHYLTRHQVTVGRLYSTLDNYCNAMHTFSKSTDLYDFIRTSTRKTTSRH